MNASTPFLMNERQRACSPRADGQFQQAGGGPPAPSGNVTDDPSQGSSPMRIWASSSRELTLAAHRANTICTIDPRGLVGTRSRRSVEARQWSAFIQKSQNTLRSSRKTPAGLPSSYETSTALTDRRGQRLYVLSCYSNNDRAAASKISVRDPQGRRGDVAEGASSNRWRRSHPPSRRTGTVPRRKSSPAGHGGSVRDCAESIVRSVSTAAHFIAS